jgi:hypothetical protein
MSTLDLTSSCIDFSPVDGTYSVVALYRDAGGTLREGPSSTITVVPLLPPYTSYYFKNTSVFTGTNCGAAGGLRDATDSYAGTGSDSSFSFGGGITSLNFCTRSLSAADAAVAGTTKVYAWGTSTGGGSCTITAALGVNAVGSTTATQTLAGGATHAPLVWSFNTSAYSFAAGDRLNVTFTEPNGASCNATSLQFGSTARRSRVDLPIAGGGSPVGKPSPPTGLGGVANADGSKTLTWTAPASGNPVAFYRIYRDGVEYTQRYDQTGDTTPSYTDPGDGNTHTYYVTAVSTNLAESSYLGPVSL